MNKKLNLTVFLMLAVGGAMCGAIFSRMFTGTSAQAQQSSRAKMPSYEYCVINQALAVREGDKVKGTVRICFLQASGFECQTVESTGGFDSKYVGYSFDKTRNDAVAKAVAKLGSEGWEMMGTGFPYLTADTQDSVYFKRQKF